MKAACMLAVLISDSERNRKHGQPSPLRAYAACKGKSRRVESAIREEDGTRAGDADLQRETAHQRPQAPESSSLAS